jgi:ATP-dependent protease ClpP protease subunit/cellobiose-specific phosphotransferase system component IIA
MKKIAISGVIGWDSTAAGLREALKEAAGADVEITISSPGGFVSDGLEMFNLIRNYAGTTVARLSGYAMSMASYIPLAADRIIAEDNAIYMIHNVRGGVFGDHNDILNYGATTKGMSRLIAKAYCKRSGKTLAEVEKMMDVETYLFGEEMVDHGFIDEIITTDAEKDPETARAMACFALQECSGRMSADISAVKRDLASASVMLGAMNATPKKEVKEKIMNLEMLKTEHPDLVEALRAEAAAGQAAALSAAKAEGAAAERDRIASVRACLIPGHEALIETLAADGQSSAADAALAIVAAEKQLRTSAAADLLNEAPPLVASADSETAEQSRSMKRAEFNKLSLTEQSAVVKGGTRIVE